MVAGILVGLCFLGAPALTTQYIKPIGTIFINLLKFIVVPIVLLSLICGMISMKDIKKVGSIGWKTLVYYMVTTLIAIVIGLVVANLFKGAFPLLDTTGAEYTAKNSNFMDTISPQKPLPGCFSCETARLTFPPLPPTIEAKDRPCNRAHIKSTEAGE